MAEGEDLWVRVTWRSLNLVGLLPLASGGEEGTGSCEVIVVSEADGKLVVAVPSTAWARKLAERRLPRGSLSKVVSVEVAAVSPEERGLLVEGATVKLWVGLLDPALMGSLSFEGTEAADLPFAQDAHGVGLLPHAASLVASVEKPSRTWSLCLGRVRCRAGPRQCWDQCACGPFGGCYVQGRPNKVLPPMPRLEPPSVAHAKRAPAPAERPEPTMFANLDPCPAPYPEVFVRGPREPCGWRKVQVCLIVLLLSWLHLGCPVQCPATCALGTKLYWTHAHSGHSIMKLAWCPESGPANWAENLNKKLLNRSTLLVPSSPQMIEHTGWTHTWTTTLKGSENGYSPHPN